MDGKELHWIIIYDCWKKNLADNGVKPSMCRVGMGIDWSMKISVISSCFDVVLEEIQVSQDSCEGEHLYKIKAEKRLGVDDTSTLKSVSILER